MSNFDSICDLVLDHEAALTTDPADPGNWTGGRVGAGTCRGTKFGISAAAYPELDIAGLSFDQAKELYQRDYWEKIAGDQLPGALALVVLDAAINNGPGRAVHWLQESLGVAPDGVIGPRTLAAVGRASAEPGRVIQTCGEFLARRAVFMASLSTWPRFGLGWARRLFKLPFEAMRYLER